TTAKRGRLKGTATPHPQRSRCRRSARLRYRPRPTTEGPIMPGYRSRGETNPESRYGRGPSEVRYPMPTSAASAPCSSHVGATRATVTAPVATDDLCARQPGDHDKRQQRDGAAFKRNPVRPHEQNSVQPSISAAP